MRRVLTHPVRWRLVVVSLLLTAFGVVTPAADPVAAQAPTQYQNPLVNGLTMNPAIVKVGGTFFAYFNGLDYAGHQNVPVYTSPNLVDWSQASPLNALPDANAGAWASTTTGKNFSSPSVVEIPANPAASRYVMYFTGIQASTGSKCIGVATASSPTGPFLGAADPLICPPGGAQDPSIIVIYGYPQLIYRKNGAGPGIYSQRLTADGLAPNGTSPSLLYTANPTWWHDGHVDRPAIALAGGQVLLFFAGKAPGDADRAIGWSTCSTYIFVITSCKQQQNFGTWLAPNAQVPSIGGMQVFKDGASDWVVYDAGSKMRVDKLCVDHGQPRTNGPSSIPQPLARTSGDCSLDIPGAPFGVASVDDSLVIGQAPKVSFRDGGASVPLDGRILWMFSDTLTRSPCHALTNSAALGIPAAGATGPTWTTEPGDADGCPSPYVPYTAEEADYTATNWSCSPSPTCPGKRIILWEVGAVPRSDGAATGFFWKMIHDADNDGEIRDPETGEIISEDGNGDGYADEGCGLCYEALGHGLARVDPGSTVVDRSPAASPVGCNPTCLFVPTDFATPDDPDGEPGVRRPFLDEEFVYAWVGGKLARVPIADLQTEAAWEFWTDVAPPNAWSTTFADADNVPGLRTGIWEVPVGQVNYNPYLDQFVNMTPEGIFSRYKLYMQTAPAPEGPWTTAAFVYDANSKKCPADEVSTYDTYGFGQAPALATNGGRSIFGVYARPGPSFGMDPACPGQMRVVEVRLQ